jgi:protein TonB
MVAAALHVSLAMYGPSHAPAAAGCVKEKTPRSPDPLPFDPIVPLEEPDESPAAPGPLGRTEVLPPEIQPLPNNTAILVQTEDRVPLVPVDHRWTGPLPAEPFGPGSGGVGNPQIFAPADLDNIPRALSQIAPAFPRELQNAGIGGTVSVEFTVDSTGRVVSANVVTGTRREFEDAAVRAVLRWRFEPGKRHGRLVPFRMVIPISFKTTDV